MNKRDLIADLKICNKATSGPWLIADEPEVIIENTFSSPILFSAVAFEDDLGASKVEALKTEDLDFILQAREGWPHAIERALEAEEWAEELEDFIKNLTEALRATMDLTKALAEDLKQINPAYDEVIDVVEVLGGVALDKAKEVLGDE